MVGILTVWRGTDAHIENTMRTSNDLRYQVRGVKLAILDEAMKRDDAIRIMYASKYAASSNYWKFSLGQNKALKDLNVIEEKQALEKEIREWVAQNHKTQYIGILDSLKVLYKENFPGDYTVTLLEESFYSGSDIMQFAMKSMIRYLRPDAENDGFKDDVKKTYRDIDINLDKKVFAAMIKNYKQQALSEDDLPDFYEEINEKFDGNIDAYVDNLYANSVLTDCEKVNRLESIEDLHDDPIYYVAVSVITKIFQSHQSNSIDEYERLLGDALRETLGCRTPGFPAL